MKSEPTFLYILQSDTLKRHYIGVSKNPQRRLKYHNTSDRGWTRRGRPWKLIFTKHFTSKQEAVQWERWIKRQKNSSLIQRIVSNDFVWQK